MTIVPTALRGRMAEIYGVALDRVLPVRGAAHGLELLMRRAALDGAGSVAAEGPVAERLARINRLRLVEEADQDTGLVVTSEISPGDCRDLAVAAALVAIDETGIEFSEKGSLAGLSSELRNVAVLRDLSAAYGAAGGAVIADPGLIARLEEALEPFALPPVLTAAAEAALSPSRMLQVQARTDLVKTERERLRQALTSAGIEAEARQGCWLFVRPADMSGAPAALARFGVPVEAVDGGVRLEVGTPEANDRVLAALGVVLDTPPRRRAEAVRDTKETRIALTLDLDQSRPVEVRTGVGFYDHMLEQVASHGGFSLVLGCEGDLHIDPHHVIEDCALALGSALKTALGDRRGIGRFGFVLPMDETEAQVSIDLGGRPYSVFEGAFRDSRIGDYPTEMTPHVFRSLAETLGAAIHVRVQGQNDHHKTEACFKALGRALRQAVRVESSDIPSTKGVI